MLSTYIIFDATGISDQQNSNYPYLATLSAWQHSYPERFKFSDLEDVLFCATHSYQDDGTLRGYLQKKLDQADSVIILASEKLRTDSTILNWQVEHAIRLNIPVIVTYVGIDKLSVEMLPALQNRLPQALAKGIAHGVKVAHIPFTMDKIERACKNFSKENRVYAWTGQTIY